MKLSLTTKHILAGLIALLLTGFIVISFVFRSVQASDFSEASDYIATSTSSNGAYGAISAGELIRRSSGSFGSIIITGANTGVLNIYNATTTNVNLRTGNTPTSTILLASIPANTVAGTYTFDAQYTVGLYLDLVSGVMPTSTITYR